MNPMIGIIKEYGCFYGVNIVNLPDFELSKWCKINGHEMIRDQIASYCHFVDNGSYTTVDSFNDTCQACSVKHYCYRLNDYDKQEIEMNNKFTYAVNVALEKCRVVYFEFNLPQNDFCPIKNCKTCNYEPDYAKIKEGSKLTDDSLIVKNDYKIEYEVGSCVNCNHRYVKIIPINLKHNNLIHLSESDFTTKSIPYSWSILEYENDSKIPMDKYQIKIK